MDSLQQETVKAAAITLIGLLWRATRKAQNFPNWLGWVIVAVGVIAGWIWATPNWYSGDWRISGLDLYTFTIAALGIAATGSDTHITKEGL